MRSRRDECKAVLKWNAIITSERPWKGVPPLTPSEPQLEATLIETHLDVLAVLRFAVLELATEPWVERDQECPRRVPDAD